MERRSIRIEGIVQGVGFRPFVYQLARRCAVTGWVRNDSRGVLIEAQGPETSLADFLRGLREEHPPLAAISRFETSALPTVAESGFSILASDAAQAKTAQIAPDTHVCADCLRELFDPADRRYLYPFINCTNCGPRYTIVSAIPYDRPNTTMAAFPLCPACREEYRVPALSRPTQRLPGLRAASGPGRPERARD